MSTAKQDLANECLPGIYVIQTGRHPVAPMLRRLKSHSGVTPISIFNPKQVFRELRRRRVFNTVALYIIGAWVALQVAELAFPALGIPERAIRYVWLGAFLLFPLVLVFGWRYDISKEGIRRTPGTGAAKGADTSLKRPDHFTIGSLSLVALAVIAVMLFEISRVEPEERAVVVPQENSIAVLPFGVCDERINDVPLAGGLTGEVISLLAQRDRLKVIGRSTSFQLSSVGLSSQRVAELTKTQFVLTGTLCRDSMNLQVEAELKDEDGFIVWRERFEEVTTRFDQVEKRLARLVANGVALELGDVIDDVKDSPVNRLALEQLLIGQEYARRDYDEKARTAFEQALEYQPDFAEAVWELALLELNAGNLSNRGTAIEKTLPLAEKALDLALSELEQGVPDFKAHWIAGRILRSLAWLDQERIWRDAGDLGEEVVAARREEARQRLLDAEQHLRSALVLNPSASDVRATLANTLRRLGVHRNSEALEIMQEGWALDPFNIHFGRQLASVLAGSGQYRQSMEVLDRFEVLPDGKRPLHWIQLEIMNNYSRFDDKLATLFEILESDPEGMVIEEGKEMEWGPVAHFWWTVCEITGLGLYEEAESLYTQVERIPYPEDSDWVTWARDAFLVDCYREATGQLGEVLEKNLAKIAGMSNEEILDAWFVQATIHAWTLWQSGLRERAIDLYEAVRHVQQAPLWSERQIGNTLWLAEMYLDVGRQEDATLLLNEATGYLEEQFNAGIRHPATLMHLATARVMLGEDDAALDMLKLAVDYGAWDLVFERKEPAFSDVRLWTRMQRDPRFIQSINRMTSIKEQQAANIRNLLDQYDVEELLLPLIEYIERRMQESEG